MATPNTPRNEAVTIRQLAALAGVSRTTVSLALRNHPRVSDSVRLQIKNLAELHGYQRDAVVSSLMARLSVKKDRREPDSIAFLTFFNRRDEWRKVHNQARYFAGAEKEASRLGYRIEPFWARDPGISLKKLSSILYHRSIKGVMLPPLSAASGHLSLNWNYFASVALGMSIYRPSLHRVSHSHTGGMILALRRLKKLGYRRIGFACTLDQNRRTGQNWLGAYLLYDFGRARSTTLPPLLLKDWSGKKFSAWLERYKPDAILGNDPAMPVLLAECGLQCPRDIGFASLDRADPKTGVSGIDQQPEEIGRTAANHLVTQMQDNENGLPSHPQTIYLEGAWVDGNTTRQVEAR